MKPKELNAELLIEDNTEISFRQKAITRLVTDHSDLPEERVARWLELLNDQCDGDRITAAKARLMATTAVWTMMDVRDSRKIT